MSTFQSFEEIEAWKKARQLTREIYDASNKDSFSRDYALRNQIRRASTSIMSNIAEGFERGGSKEFIQFLSISKGSAGEVKSQLYVALDQDYLDQGNFKRLISLVDEIALIIGGLMVYLRKSEMKGPKYTK
ncbi:MAG: four helix bundle protein [Syntrophales bacterium]|nr:four helix bundle protein [Syntrophales bacterium]MDD5533544.1 four helix bundle protein [Syntrophales bacterium]